MKKCFFFLLLVLPGLPSLLWAQWTNLGDAVNTNVAYAADYPSLSVLNQTPEVSFIGTTGTGSAGNAYVVEWKNNAAWSQVGSSLNQSNSQTAYSPSLAQSSETSDVAWAEEVNGVSLLYAKSRALDDWYPLGSVCLNQQGGHSAIMPSLAMQGTSPFVAWCESSGLSHVIYVKNWQSPTWVPVGTQALNVNDLGAWEGLEPAMCASDSTPYAAWTEKPLLGNSITAASQIYVKTWADSSWTLLGNSSINHNAQRHAQQPSMTLHQGRPVVAWSEYDGQSWKIIVKRWTGSAWEQTGGALNVNPAQDASQPSISSDGNKVLAVAWREQSVSATQIYARYWDNKTWVLLDASLNKIQGNSASRPQIKVCSGNIYVAWSETTALGSNVYLNKWSGDLPIYNPVQGNYFQAWGNRFNPVRNETTTMVWNLTKDASVSITLYTLDGQKVRNLVNNQASSAEVQGQAVWDGKNDKNSLVASGIYLALLEAGDFKKWVKIGVVK